MQYTFFLLLIVVAAVSATVTKFAERHEEHFETFKAKYARVYESDAEHSRRKELFRAAMIRVDQKNEVNVRENGEAVFGITKYSDWTEEEFSVLLGRKGRQYKSTGNEQTLAPISFTNNKGLRGLGALPSYVNWGTSGKVTPVKNQGE